MSPQARLSGERQLSSGLMRERDDDVGFCVRRYDLLLKKESVFFIWPIADPGLCRLIIVTSGWRQNFCLLKWYISGIRGFAAAFPSSPQDSAVNSTHYIVGRGVLWRSVVGKCFLPLHTAELAPWGLRRDMHCRTVNLFALYILFTLHLLLEPRLLSHSPCPAFMPLWEVTNECGFEGLFMGLCRGVPL